MTLTALAQPQAVAPALWVSWMRLTAFRNYPRAELACDGRPVVLIGPNGAGKTNLLEAVSFLAPGRGLRRARIGEVDRRGTARAGDAAATGGEAWSVAARIETPEGRREVGTGRDTTAEGRERRIIRIDGATAGRQQDLGELVVATWLTPSMDRLFQEAPSGRRRFLDRLVSALDPEHATRVNRYDHALRERARLLRDGRGGDPAWLTALEQRMAEQAVAIAAARRELVDRLARACRRELGPFPKAGLGLAGDLESWLGQMPALDAEERLRAALQGSRGRDRESGGAAYGPHRSDLLARHLDKDLPAEQCSTGEQKALLISLILGHARLLAAERGFAPLVLLDEVAAHLDAERRAALFEELLGLGAQAWMTGTEAGLFEGLARRAQAFEVRDGTIRPAALTGPS